VGGADTLSVAVSYVQMGGWELFRRRVGGLSLARMRMVCTDQMGITQPAAVKRAIASGIQVRNFAGEVTYHPKVFLAHDSSHRPIRFLVGSANLSSAAFTDSVEAGVLAADSSGLRTLNDWFNDLFQNRSAQFTPERLRTMEENWRRAASGRARARLRVRRALVTPAGAAPPIEAEDLDTLEDVFATVQLPIGLLNMDYAGNNIRNVGRVREVLREWDTVRTSARAAAGKQRSEMKLLGFADGHDLTELGRRAAAARGEEEVAELWCGWLQRTPDTELAAVNERLLVAKRVFPQFWRLQADVRDYFLANAQSPRERRVLQTIEFLCNATAVAADLSLEDMRTLAPLMEQPRRLPPHLRAEVADYFENKGTRSWDFADRRTLPLAWREAERER